MFFTNELRSSARGPLGCFREDRRGGRESIGAKLPRVVSGRSPTRRGVIRPKVHYNRFTTELDPRGEALWVAYERWWMAGAGSQTWLAWTGWGKAPFSQLVTKSRLSAGGSGRSPCGMEAQEHRRCWREPIGAKPPLPLGGKVNIQGWGSGVLNEN